MVNVSSWVKTGSINEDDKNNGISHFLEHLMFKGTHKHPAGEFDHILEARGAIVNAATWKDYTFYYVTLPKGENNENFNLAIELHADMMTNPQIPDYEMGAPFDVNDKNVTDKRERHVVIEEIRMRKDQPWTKVYNATNHAMYTNHPYKRDVIGTPEIISQVSQEEIMNYYAVGQCTPGVIAVNVATFIGYKLKGLWGAVFATLGVISPSIVIIMVIAAFISNFAHIPAVQHALAGINVIVSVLVLNAVINLWKKGVKNIFGIIIFALAFVVSVFLDISPLYAIVVSVICGILYGKKTSQKGGRAK